jgi:hypothetical protein
LEPVVADVDPFTGVWKCNLAKSQFSTPPPLSWTQYVTASATHLSVHEEIARSVGAPAVVSVVAEFDGRDYPVQGSQLAEVIAYTRTDFEIVGTARRGGIGCLREALVSDDRLTMTMRYSILSGEKEVASGLAVFERTA